MSRIFKNLIPYWKSVVLTLLLLFVQACCDLALPAYTSDIIDVGIQNNGISHIMPEAVTEREYEQAQILMTEEEAQFWCDSYEKQEDGSYRLSIEGEKKLDESDDRMLMALLMNSQTASMKEETFRQMLEEGEAAALLKGMSLEQIEKLTGADLDIQLREEEAEDGSMTQVTYVDARGLLGVMKEAGQLDEETLLAMRESLESTMETMGSALVHSMGVAYAVQCDEAAGLDMNRIQQRYLLLSGAKMVGMALLMAVTTVLVGLLASRIGAGIGMDMRGRVFKKVVSFSNAEMDRFSTASLITRCTNDVQQVQGMTVMLLRMVAYAPILGIGGVLRVIQTGAGMGWAIALAVLLILGFVAVLMAVAMPKFRVMQRLVDKVNLVSREILTGLSVIRAFGREKKEEERFDEANRDLTGTMIFTNHVMNFMMPGMSMIMYGLSVTIIWVAAHRIDAGVMQVGEMTAFLTYSMQIVMAFLMLTMLSVMLPRAAVAADRIEEVLNTEPTIEEKEQPQHLGTCKGILSFHHVGFRYPGADEEALTDIDFTAEPGKTTAVIGSTGCGKSTLVNLIPRLYDVTAGSVTLDGKDIRDLSVKELRESIGFVPQKAVLFSGTIATNLRFGKRDASDAEIEEAADIAQASGFIGEKSDGYDSRIAQGGANVSGGQKQRLAIARAIAKNPRIYIFDDSFSALDLKTDAALRKALGPKTKDAAVIIVAQRISTILHADQILVLDDGRIVGKGTHSELMKSCEVYRQIAKSQLSASELEGCRDRGKEAAANG